MHKEYVKQYSELERTHWWFRARAIILTTILRRYLPAEKLSILNVGAASGETSRWLSAFGTVNSVEYDKDFVKMMKDQGQQVTEASILDLPFEDQRFDLVCAFDVLEHVDNDSKAMSEMKRVCKEGGLLCVTVPADRKLWSAHDVINKHYRRYQIADFRALGKTLKPVFISYFNFFLYIPVWIVREWSKRFTITEKSDFERFKTSKFSNRILMSVFSFESKLLPAIHFPFGVSLFGLWRKSVQPLQ